VPTHEEIIAEGRRWQRRRELTIGTALLAIGLSLLLGLDISSGWEVIPVWAAIGLGGAQVLHGLFSVASRGTRS
jgi:hypothetical protein